jgi:DNA-binding NtrC family response regulator
METLKLYRGEQLLTQVALGERALEVGTASGCDLVVDDPDLSARHWLAMRRLGTVVAYDVSLGRRGQPRHLPLGTRVALGRNHSLVRERKPRVESPAVRERDTESLPIERHSCAQIDVVVGQGADARRLRIRDRPLHVGRGADNHLVLVDAAVSEFHCRFEPSGEGLVLRDLSSRNGTFVNGLSIDRVLVDRGAQIRIGRTQLKLVSRDAAGLVTGTRLVAESAAMLAVLAEAERFSTLPWPALILGESGTGKEGIAALLHERGGRPGPLVTLNGGGVPSGLVESELFGHERGAFTGANNVRRGAFEQADAGTLFLDEIGELPLSLQARLLRVLESGEVRRVGGEITRRVDVRVVCATHRDLRAMVAAGSFRQDLYFRIARLVLELPPLRCRVEDVRALSAYLLQRLEPIVGPRQLTRDASERLCSYAWPGNVRELRNVLSAAAVAAGSQRIELAHIEGALQRLGGFTRSATPMAAAALQEAIDHHRGNLSAAARALGLPRSTLRDRLKQVGSRAEHAGAMQAP